MRDKIKGMDTKSRILLFINVVSVIAVVVFAYVWVFVEKAYPIDFHIPCDYTKESCFYDDCSDGVTGCVPNNYAILTTNEKNVFDRCGSTITGCNYLSCDQGEPNCLITYCDPTTDTCATTTPPTAQ